MSKNSSSYRQIFKATSIFGGVQVFNILIAILRSKGVAIFLGPAGMGIVGLLTSTTGFITSLTNFGIGTSAVKNVAAAYGVDDDHKLGKTVAVFRRLVWATGLLGFIVTLLLSPWLSQISFGNKSYTVAFALISITLLLSQLSEGQTVILRGTRKVTYIAKSSMIGALTGLIISMPFYFLFRENGIVPAIIATSITTLLLTWYFALKVNILEVEVDKKTILAEGKEMLKMGFLINLSGLITLGTSFLVRIFISNKGGVADVGLYIAGFAIINTYVGLVFNAMSTDYYPRLAVVANDNVKCRIEINQQGEIALLILAPILIVFLVFIDQAVVLLYSKEFTAATQMIYWAVLGIFFKAVSWAIAFIFIAKSEGKFFFLNELVANIYLLSLNIAGYYFMGLTGLGISFLVAYFLYFIQVYLLSKSRYAFSLEKRFLKVFLLQFALALACFLVIQILHKTYAFIFGTGIIITSSIFSFAELDKRLGLKQLIFKYLKIK